LFPLVNTTNKCSNTRKIHCAWTCALRDSWIG